MTRVLVNSNGKAFTTSNNRVLSSSGITPSGSISITENDTYDVTSYASAIVNVSGGGSSPVIESLNVTPSTSAQTITAESGVDGYSPVNVSAVTSSIDANIIAGNIKDGVTILGVTGNYQGSGGGSAILITKNITQNGTYSASSDSADGYSSVTVNVSGSAPDGYIPQVSIDGMLSAPRTAFTYTLPSGVTSIPMYGLTCVFRGSGLTSISGLSNITSIGEYGLYYTFKGCTNLTNVDLSSLTSISFNALDHAFQSCSGLISVDLSSVTTVTDSGLYYAFADCTNLTNVDLSSLTTVGEDCLMDAFEGCTSLISIDLSSLTSIGGSSLNEAFLGCTSLTSVNLSGLTTITDYSYGSLAHAFRGCTNLVSLSFPSLEEQSWWEEEDIDEYTLFTDMLYGVTGCTVHFPSNLESTVGTWSDTLAGFGGTNTTVLFDLPATE